MEIAFLLMIAVFFCMTIAGMILWIWAIVDCATNEPSEGNEKIVWIIVIVFTNWIGGLIYFLVRRPQRIREHGR